MVTIDKLDKTFGPIKNAKKMPFSFRGVNNFKVPVIIITKSTCGCAVTNTGFTVQPGASFDINGYLKQRNNKGTYRKKVKVTVQQDVKKVIQNIELFFTMQVI